jgi:hypothetical protein
MKDIGVNGTAQAKRKSRASVSKKQLKPEPESEEEDDQPLVLHPFSPFVAFPPRGYISNVD